MEINRSSTHHSAKGPAEYFSGTVRVDQRLLAGLARA